MISLTVRISIISIFIFIFLWLTLADFLFLFIKIKILLKLGSRTGPFDPRGPQDGGWTNLFGPRKKRGGLTRSTANAGGPYAERAGPLIHP